MMIVNDFEDTISNNITATNEKVIVLINAELYFVGVKE